MEFSLLTITRALSYYDYGYTKTTSDYEHHVNETFFNPQTLVFFFFKLLEEYIDEMYWQ